MNYLNHGSDNNMTPYLYQWSNSSTSASTTCMGNEWESYTSGPSAATGTISYGSSKDITYKANIIYNNAINNKIIRCDNDYGWSGVDYGSTSGSTQCYAYGPRSYEEAQTGNWGWWTAEDCRPTLPPAEHLKQIIEARQGPAVHIRPSRYYNPADEREIRARETLRRVIGERNYRYFLKTGCVNVRGGKSGMMYRIYKGHMVDAYKDGVLVERLCVYLKGDFPPADEIITKFLMVINNEDQFRAIANISRGSGRRQPAAQVKQDTRSLPEIFRELKAA